MTKTLTCPMCKKTLEPAVTPCPRCRADLTLLVDYMSNLEEHLNRADAALKAGELGEAVWAYLNVLETDPEHPVAKRQVTTVATTVRQFDDAKRASRNSMMLLGAGLLLAVLMALGGTFYLGYQFGARSTTATYGDAP